MGCCVCWKKLQDYIRELTVAMYEALSKNIRMWRRFFFVSWFTSLSMSKRCLLSSRLSCWQCKLLMIAQALCFKTTRFLHLSAHQRLELFTSGTIRNHSCNSLGKISLMANFFYQGWLHCFSVVVKKLKFYSANSCVLQLIDSNWKLKWLPTKQSNSVRFLPS